MTAIAMLASALPRLISHTPATPKISPAINVENDKSIVYYSDMKVVIQRVKSASVTVDGKLISKIDRGVLTLFGVAKGDTEAQCEKTIKKISDLRIFEDDAGKMNLSLKDIQGEHLIVSQFTLYGDCSQGRRPSFIQAEEPKRANELYEHALKVSANEGLKTSGGQFQAHMNVALENDGPVTFVIEV